MITIRLSRTGVKNRPFFHITVADSRMPRDGRFIERVGYFNPIAAGKEIRLHFDQERIDYWLTQGAQVSERVLSLFKEHNETLEQRDKRKQKKEQKRLRKVAKKMKVTQEVKEETPTEEAKEEEAEVTQEVKEETPTEEAKEEEAESSSNKIDQEKPGK